MYLRQIASILVATLVLAGCDEKSCTPGDVRCGNRTTLNDVIEQCSADGAWEVRSFCSTDERTCVQPPHAEAFCSVLRGPADECAGRDGETVCVATKLVRCGQGAASGYAVDGEDCEKAPRCEAALASGESDFETMRDLCVAQSEAFCGGGKRCNGAVLEYCEKDLIANWAEERNCGAAELCVEEPPYSAHCVDANGS